MHEENPTAFKVFRVLWFPMSINAVALGAAAAGLFWLGTGLACTLAGNRDLTSASTRAFLPNAANAVAHGDWPGFAIDRNAEGRSVAPNPEAGTPAADEIGRFAETFRSAVSERRRVIAAATLSESEKTEALEALQRFPDRFRWVFAAQLVLFFGLWSTFGVAIARVMALRIARDEYPTLSDAFGYAWRVRLTGLLFAPAVAIPLGFLLACIFGANAVGSVPYVGWLLGVILLPFSLVAAVLLVLGCTASIGALGLVPAAIAIERKGTYDSLGKALSYVFARPVPLLLYALLVGAFLTLFESLFLSNSFVEGLLHGAFLDSTWTYRDVVIGNLDGKSVTGVAWFAALLHGIVLGGFRLLVYGALISYAIGAFTAAFFIFREDVDGVPCDDLAVDAKPTKVAAPAPPSEPAPPAATPTT